MDRSLYPEILVWFNIYTETAFLEVQYSSILKIRLETEAKIYVQQKIMNGAHELAWSYVMDYENSLNPFLERRYRIALWKGIAKVFCDENETILTEAEKLRDIGLKFFDSLHVACSVFLECDYFLTTDDRLEKKIISAIRVINPIEFIRTEEFR